MTNNNLKKQKQQLLQQPRPPRPRDAAKQLGITECEYVSLSLDTGVTMLDSSRILAILTEINNLSEVMALTRNESVVLEQYEIYQNININDNKVTFDNDKFSLIIDIIDIKYIFAVKDNNKSSLQFFDKFGEAVHKIYLGKNSAFDKYDKLVANYRIDKKDIRLSKKLATKPYNKIKDLDNTELLSYLDKFQDDSDINQFLIKYNISKVDMYQILIDNNVIKLDINTLENFLLQLVNAKLPLVIVNSNNSVTQIHRRIINKIVSIQQWVNVLDPDFNLHANIQSIQYMFFVTTYFKEEPFHTLELFDKNESLVMKIYLDNSVDNYQQNEQIFLDILEDMND